MDASLVEQFNVTITVGNRKICSVMSEDNIKEIRFQQERIRLKVAERGISGDVMIDALSQSLPNDSHEAGEIFAVFFNAFHLLGVFVRGKLISEENYNTLLADEEFGPFSKRGQHDEESMHARHRIEMATARILRELPAPFWTWGCAILAAKAKDRDAEIAFMVDYVDTCR